VNSGIEGEVYANPIPCVFHSDKSKIGHFSELECALEELALGQGFWRVHRFFRNIRPYSLGQG
jgi:hypothetical protein